MAFSAVFNFRDLGGYPGLEGRTVRWRRLYRSDTLSRLCDADREAFEALGIRTVVDLRRPYEIERDGRCPQWNGLVWHNIDPNHPEWDPGLYDETAGPARFLADRYLELAETGREGLARALAVLADADAAPAVVHCVAGKDRTGVLAALTLALLGVSDVDIATEYAMTQQAGRKFTAWLHANHPELASRTPPVFYTVTPPEAMLLFLEELRERHGSVERYVLDSGLERHQIAALREHLLTDASVARSFLHPANRQPRRIKETG
jgi:protein tyrosine/serine phosphatase